MSLHNLEPKAEIDSPPPSSDVEDQLQPIAEESRTTRVGGQFWIWAGANLAPINWVLGALGVEMGLGVRATVIVIALALASPS